MRTWERTEYFWKYRDDGLPVKGQPREGLAYPILLTNISSAAQEDGRGVMRFSFSMRGNGILEEASEEAVGVSRTWLFRLLLDTVRKTMVAEVKFGGCCLDAGNWLSSIILSFALRFRPTENSRSFTEATFDVLIAVIEALGIDRKDARGGMARRETLGWFDDGLGHGPHWVNFAEIEEFKRGMSSMTIGVINCADDF